jgi:hypothetical protein
MFACMKTATEPTTESVWRERVAQWRASGKSADAFAEGRGFAGSTLRYWSSRLGPTAPSGFVRLVPKPPAPTPGLVVEVGDVRVRVVPGFDAALLAQLVQVLRGATR